MLAEQENKKRLQGNPCVLIVDDEELMREVTKLIIEENGGSVLLAQDGAEGVEVYKQHTQQIKYVVLDFSMPLLDGYEAFQQIRLNNPGSKILLVSGLKAIPEVRDAEKKGELVFLSKPFHESELVDALNKLGGY